MSATTVGLRELRQNASDLIRRVEAGEDITVTVAGRPVVQLVAISKTPRYWRKWDEIKGIWNTPAKGWENWQEERDGFIDQAIEDPWERAERRKAEREGDGS